MTLAIWAGLLLFTAGMCLIHRYFLKKEKRNARIAKEWDYAADKVQQYILDFHARQDNMNRKPGSSLEEIDMVDPYETATYRKLLRKKRKAWIAYVEINHYLVDKGDLIALLAEIADDKDLSRRVMNLICFIETP